MVESVFQIHRDNQGNITELVNEAGTVKSFYYTPWGQGATSDGAPKAHGYTIEDNTFCPGFIRGYLGQEYLAEFGLMNLNARLYNPYLGRFISPDPILDPDGDAFGLNPYIYGKNNPLSFVDPDGKFAEWAIFALATFLETTSTAYFVDGKSFGESFKQGLVSVGASIVTSGVIQLAHPNFIGAGVALGGTTGAIVGGTASALTGGNFWDGALQGAISGALQGGLAGYENEKINLAKKRNIASGGSGAWYNRRKITALQQQISTHYNQQDAYELFRKTGILLFQGNDGYCYAYVVANGSLVLTGGDAFQAVCAYYACCEANSIYDILFPGKGLGKPVGVNGFNVEVTDFNNENSAKGFENGEFAAIAMLEGDYEVRNGDVITKGSYSHLVNICGLHYDYCHQLSYITVYDQLAGKSGSFYNVFPWDITCPNAHKTEFRFGWGYKITK